MLIRTKLLALAAYLTNIRDTLLKEASRLSRTASMRHARGDMAAASLSGIGAVAITIAAVIVGAVVALILLASLFPSYQGAVANLSDNFTNADWGNAAANSISPTFGMLIAIGGMFALVGLAFAAYKLSK